MHLDRKRHISPNRLIRMVVNMIALAGFSAQVDASAGALLAQPNPAQSAADDKALGSAPASFKADVTAALPTLRPYIVTLMCVQDDMAIRALVEKFVGSRGTVMFNGWLGAMSPAKRMLHHDMVGCLTSPVSRTSGGSPRTSSRSTSCLPPTTAARATCGRTRSTRSPTGRG